MKRSTSARPPVGMGAFLSISGFAGGCSDAAVPVCPAPLETLPRPLFTCLETISGEWADNPDYYGPAPYAIGEVTVVGDAAAYPDCFASTGTVPDAANADAPDGATYVRFETAEGGEWVVGTRIPNGLASLSVGDPIRVDVGVTRPTPDPGNWSEYVFSLFVYSGDALVLGVEASGDVTKLEPAPGLTLVEADPTCTDPVYGALRRSVAVTAGDAPAALVAEGDSASVAGYAVWNGMVRVATREPPPPSARDLAIVAAARIP